MQKMLKNYLVAFGIAGLLVSAAHANPTGPEVVHGEVSINSTHAGILEITNSPNAIINWQGFSINANEITRFIQQGGHSSILNRVTGGDPSQILGQLISNGQVWLINPNGVVFGHGATIDTAGLVVSTLQISDNDFLSGNLDFGDGSDSAGIINQGLITTNGDGDVLLVAPNIENSGIIRSDNGDLILAAGRKIHLTSLDYDNITFEVQAPSDSVVNIGTLLTQGGAVAAYAGQLHHSGTIEANRISQSDDGTVMLIADNNRVSGSINAIGRNGSAGGIVHILGDEVSLNGASINASGDSGGGEVLVGGDYQGQGNIRSATNTVVDALSQINTSANVDGDGGKIIIWADNHTDSFGQLISRGGVLFGNGGFVETSGRNTLNFGQPADVGANNGDPGTWLLDPSDITIGASEAASIESALNAGSNVEVKTSDSGSGQGNISVNADITKSEGESAALTLRAHHSIFINGTISSTSNALHVNLVAGKTIKINGAIRSNGGNVSTSIIAPQLEESTEEIVTEENETPPAIAERPPASEGSAPASTDQQSPTTETIAENNSDGELESSQSSAPALLSVEEALEPDTDTINDSVPPQNLIAVDGEIISQGGKIIIDSGIGTSHIAGIVDSSDIHQAEVGGDLYVLGQEIQLVDQATLNASGGSGGGEVLVGGDIRGSNPDIPNALNVEAGENVTIMSDAVVSGDGGNIVVWADNSTAFYGEISAKGGEESGNAGDVEVSGKQFLDYRGVADLTAKNGEGGNLLLDPGAVRIIDTTAAGYTPDAANFSDFDTTVLENNLATTASVNIDSAAVTNAGTVGIGIHNNVAWTSGSTLFLNTTGDINFGQGAGGIGSFDASGGLGQVRLNAGGTVNVPVTASITAPGNIQVIATNLFAAGDLDAGAAGNLNVLTTGTTVLAGTTTANNVTVEATDIDVTGTVTAVGDIQLSPSDAVDIEISNGLTTGFNLTQSDLNNLSAGGNVVISTATTNETITVGSDNTVNIAGTNYDVILVAGTVDIVNQFSVSNLLGLEAFDSTSSIGIGNGTPGTFNLDQGELSNLSANSVFIGTDASGQVTIGGTAPVDLATTNYDVSIFGSDVNITNGVDVGGNNLNLAPGSDATDIGLDVAVAGGFNLTETELQRIRGNSVVTIGRFGSTASGAVSIGTVDVSAGNYLFQVLGGSITVDSLDVSGNSVVLTGNTGSVIESVADNSADVIGSSTTLTAFNNIDVDTDVLSLSAISTGVGSINVSDESAVNIVGAGASTVNGDITITANGDLFVDQEINARSSGTVNLTGTNVILRADVKSTAAATGSAGDGTGIVNVLANSGSITQTSGVVQATGSGGIGSLIADGSVGSSGSHIQTDVQRLSAVSQSTGDIFISENDAVSIGNSVSGLETGNGNITLAAGGAISVIDEINARTGGNVTLQATAGDININGDILSTALSTGNLGDGGGIIRLDADSGSVTSVMGTVRANGAGGAARIVAGNSFDVMTDITRVAARSILQDGVISNTSTNNSLLTVDIVDGLNGVSIGNSSGGVGPGETGITTSHSLVVNRNISAGDGNLNLIAGTAGDNANGDDLTINAIISEDAGDNINLVAAGDVTLTNGRVETSNGDLRITADQDNIAGGRIIQTNALIVSGSLTASATDQISLRNTSNDIDSVSLTTDAGDIDFSNATDVNVTATTTTSGAISLQSDMALSVTGVVSAGGGNINLSGQSVGINDSGSVNDISTSGGEISIKTDDGMVNGDDIITVASNTTLNSGGGGITFDTDNISWGTTNALVNAGGGTFRLAPSNIGTTLGIGGSEHLNLTESELGFITADQVVIGRVDGTATIDVGSADVLIDLSGNNFDLTLQGAGINFMGAINNGARSVTLAAGTGAITDGHGGSDVTAATIVATAATGIEFDSTLNGVPSLSAVTTNGAIDISTNATQNVTVTNLSTGTGNILLGQSGGGGLTVDAAQTTDGSINIGVSGGTLTVPDVTAGGSGDVTLGTFSSGSIDVGSIAAAGNSIMVRASDAITDSNGVVNNFVASNLSLRASTGVGTTGDEIETTVTTLELENGGGGAFVINNGALILADLTTDDNEGIDVTGGGRVTASSPLTINSPGSTSGDFSYIAGNSASTGDNVTVNADLIHSGGGILNIQAGDDIIINNATIDNTGGTLNLQADLDGDGRRW